MKNENPMLGLTKNEFGYYEIKNKPSQQELAKYYAEKYYQQNSGVYKNNYSSEELDYLKNKITQKYLILINLGKPNNKSELRLLDIGAGEGFTLSYFKKHGWSVKGLDFSDYGCKVHNIDCLGDFIKGDIFQNLNKLLEEGNIFDVIWLDNVLEHVLDPVSLLQKIHKISSSSGRLVVEVPNDFSKLQLHLLQEGYIDKEFWVSCPDHISYFSNEGLSSLCKACGWKIDFVMGDYPIDFNLFNPNTNYIKQSDTGKSCHQARIAIENFLHSLSPELTNKYYKCLAEMGIGRQIIMFLSRDGA